MSGMWSWLGQTIGLGSRYRKFWGSFFGVRNSANRVVTPDTAMTVAALARGVRLCGETVGTLPLNIFDVNKPGEPVRGDNPYDLVLRVSPNDDLTSCEFWEAMVGGMILTGNSYARKLRSTLSNGTSRLIGLELVNVRPYREMPTGRLKYRGTDQFGVPIDTFAADIFHLKGFSFGGDEGLSIVQYGAQAIGTMIAAGDTTAKIIGTGLSTAGFLETGEVMEEDDRTRLQKIIDDYVASENPAKIMMLEGGMKYNRMSMSASDFQLLLEKKFGIEEIARWLGMPSVLLGHSQDGQTMWGTGVEAIIQAWYTLGLRALLTRTEKAIIKRVFEPQDRLQFFPKFNVDGLLRGDSAAQAALFGTAAQNGWLTRNEIRKYLDLPPVPGGDQLTIQVNMQLLKDVGSANSNVATSAKLALLAFLGDGEGDRRRTAA